METDRMESTTYEAPRQRLEKLLFDRGVQVFCDPIKGAIDALVAAAFDEGETLEREHRGR